VVEIKRPPTSHTWILSVCAALVIACLGVGFFMNHPHVFLIGLVGLILELLVLPIVLHIAHANHTSWMLSKGPLHKLVEQLDSVAAQLTLVTENQLLSDRTKSLAFREKDREAVRKAVAEELNRQDWDAALALVNDMDTTFGYKAEADRLRQEISERRAAVVQRQVAEHRAAIDRYVDAEAWGQALQEAQNAQTAFPDHPMVLQMPMEIEERRAALKKKLTDSWQEAVNRHDVDGSIEILKHLDIYLTPAEAEGMQEAARGVFKEKINLLRTQFTLAVQNHRWYEALRLGETIVNEFPNSRMAQEVRDMQEMLKQRAGEETAAAAKA
jgi:hypothetical protein